MNEMALHFLSKMKILVVRDIEREDIEFISKVCAYKCGHAHICVCMCLCSCMCVCVCVCVCMCSFMHGTCESLYACIWVKLLIMSVYM